MPKLSITVTGIALFKVATPGGAANFKSQLRKDVTRPFIGEEYWPNPQMDWQLNKLSLIHI